MAWFTGNEPEIRKALAEGMATERHLLARPETPKVGLSEKEFMDQVIELAKGQGWLHYHPFDSRKSVAGWPDLFFVRRDRYFWAELKSHGGRLTAAQEVWIERLREAGATVYLWRPEDWPQIMEVLK